MLSIVQIIVLTDTMISNNALNELRRMWKNTIMAYIKVLPQGTEKNHEKPQS
jgi:hypothetical protein